MSGRLIAQRCYLWCLDNTLHIMATLMHNDFPRLCLGEHFDFFAAASEMMKVREAGIWKLFKGRHGFVQFSGFEPVCFLHIALSQCFLLIRNCKFYGDILKIRLGLNIFKVCCEFFKKIYYSQIPDLLKTR